MAIGKMKALPAAMREKKPIAMLPDLGKLAGKTRDEVFQPAGHVHSGFVDALIRAII